MAQPQVLNQTRQVRTSRYNAFQAQYHPMRGLRDAEIYAPANFTVGESMLLVTASSNVMVPQVINSCVVACNEEQNSVQRTAFYMSVLNSIFPALMEISKQVLAGMGYASEVITDQDFEAYSLTLQPWIDTRACLLTFGQLVLIMFKNIASTSYGNFMSRRTAGMAALLSMDDRLAPESNDVLLSLEVAKSIRTVAGGSALYRAAILKAILVNRTGESYLSLVCNYVANIISWTEMTPLVLIFEEFCLTKSPVLRDNRIAGEVRNLHAAYQLINSTQYPQYYRVLFPTESGIYLVRNRFTILFETARKYRAEYSPTMSQFVGGGEGQNTLVLSLCGMHRAHMLRELNESMPRSLDYLYTVDQVDAVQGEEAVDTANHD